MDDRRVAIVTGGAQGIGEATTRLLYAEGSSVAIVDRDEDRARDLAKELDPTGQTALALVADVSDSSAVNRVVAEAADHFKRIDILVNNAGYNLPGRTQDVSDDDWAGLLGTHVGGTFNFSRAAFTYLKDSDSAAIVSTTSIAARFGFSARASYCAAKAAIVGFTQCIAVEWAPYGIRANAVAPGFTQTQVMDRAIAAGANLDARLARVPMGRMGAPSEIAAGIAFLTSSAASYITGETLTVDGGFSVNADEVPATRD